MNFRNDLSTVRRLAALLMGALLIVLLIAARVAAQEVEPSGVHRAEINELLAADLQAADGPVSFLVVLRDQPDPAALLAAGELQAASAVARRAALYEALTEHAARTQAPLRAWLDARGAPYTPHYLVNMIEVHGDAALAEQLRLRPEVDRLSRNPEVRGAETVIPSQAQNRFGSVGGWRGFAAERFTAAPTVALDELPYGLTYTKADEVWALGIRGAGVVVASQDTGVQWDHPALRSAYRGWDAKAQTVTHAYNWFDAFGRNSQDIQRKCSADAQVPCDDDVHGTHTVGTLVGDAGVDGGTIIGMAPEAKWVACRNMRGGVGTPASYTTCFEWLMAPYPQGGNPFTDGRPELAPDIINNSWGCPPKEGCDAGSLQQIVDTVRAAGLMIVASAGNEGMFNAPSCSTVQNPIAIYGSVFSVGAHDSGGQIAYFSSRGPVTIDGSQRLKPEITAPGMFVHSALPTHRGGYGLLSGTSMASPHVAGAVALLWSAVPEIKGNIELAEQILLKSATPVLDSGCDPAGTAQSPNNVYGYGRLDVLAAVNLARQPVTLTVAVGGNPGSVVAGQQVKLVDQRTDAVYWGVVAADGTVAWSNGSGQANLLAGAYTVWAEGCTGFTAAGAVTLAAGQTAQVDVTPAAAFCLALPEILKH